MKFTASVVVLVVSAVANAQDPSMMDLASMGGMEGMEGMDGMEDMMKAMGGGAGGGAGGMGGMGGGGMGGMPGMGGMGGPPPKAKANKGELKYINCQVCQEAVKQLARQGEAMKKASTGDKSVKWVFSKRQVQGQPVAESDYVDLADNICDETAPEGAWLKETRLKATGTEIKLVGDPDKASCGVDCQTIALSCRETYGDYSLDLASDNSPPKLQLRVSLTRGHWWGTPTLLEGGSAHPTSVLLEAEMIFNGAKRAKLTAEACNELSDVCAKKTPEVPATHKRFKDQKKQAKKNKKSKKKKSGKKKTKAQKDEL